jgi:hypothetical protein
MCHPNPRHRMFGTCDCHPPFRLSMSEGCDCHPSLRHFMSSDERQRMLEHYKEQLEKELAGVTERIDELRNG